MTQLTTLENVKTIAGITDTTNDALLTMLINRISAKVFSYLGRKLAYGTYSEVLSGSNRQLLLLKEWPIRSVTSLTINEAALTIDVDFRVDDLDALAGMVYKEDGWNPIDLVAGLTRDVVAAARNINITYVAGYYMPSDVNYVEGDDNSLPIDIIGVVEEMIIAQFIRIQAEGMGLTSRSEGGINMSWKDTVTDTVMGLTDAQALVLNAYKRATIE